MQLYRLDTNWGEVALQKRTWGCWQTRVSTSQHGTHAVPKANGLLC